MMCRMGLFAVLMGLAGIAQAQDAQPYAGQQAREIKALSAEDVSRYLDGAGIGYAKAAELNHYPGPMHVLELADQLKLTREQRAQITALMQTHKSQARELGRTVVDAERALDALFKSGKVAEQELAARVRLIAVAEGEYRLSHLDTHRRTRALLDTEQVRRYDSLRGYGGTAAGGTGHTGKH